MGGNRQPYFPIDALRVGWRGGSVGRSLENFISVQAAVQTHSLNSQINFNLISGSDEQLPCNYHNN